MFLLDTSAIEICEKLLHLVACPTCEKSFKSLPELKRHLSGVHSQTYCDVCLGGRKLFLPEQKVYSCGSGLTLHMKSGDKGDPTAPRSHTPCLFCKKYFYGTDEHYEHMTEAHEECQMCRMHGKPYQFFDDYSAIEAHFDNSHHLCKEPRCLGARYVVFATDFELKAHDVAFHLGNRKLTRREERAARQLQVNVSTRSSSSAQEARNSEQIRQEEEQREQLRIMQLMEMERERKIRNDLVVTQMIGLIGDPEYSRFKGYSKMFLQNNLTASDFYLKFIQTFGEANADILFEGVVDLLPPQFADRASALRSARARALERKSQFPSLATHQRAPPRLSSSNLSYLSSGGGISSSDFPAILPSSGSQTASSSAYASAAKIRTAPKPAPFPAPKPAPSSSNPPPPSAFPSLQSKVLPSPAPTWVAKPPKAKTAASKKKKPNPKAVGFTISEPFAQPEPKPKPTPPTQSKPSATQPKTPATQPKASSSTPAPSRPPPTASSTTSPSFAGPSSIKPPQGVDFHEIFRAPKVPASIASPIPLKQPANSGTKKRGGRKQEKLISWG